MLIELIELISENERRDMTKKTIPYLCGGTFLCQLLRARKPLVTANEHMNNVKESISEQETLRWLISIYQLSGFYGGASLKTYTSKYKSCKESLIAYAQFGDNDLRLAFDAAVKSANSVALQMMSDFVREFIDVENKGEQLVRCILGVIKDDNSVLSYDELYVENGRSVKKAELAEMSDFTIETFLLGIWHYIIMKRADKNEYGADTYSSWYAGRGTYRGTIGSDITRKIMVKSIYFSINPVYDGEATEEREETAEQKKENNAKNVQHIEQATIVNQYGNNCVHIEHLDTLNL